jgi:hypothetical protein|tara:strand:- start:6857 stop:7723 length:867 start_codon:yes stop_codon:yes gene_type:complete
MTHHAVEQTLSGAVASAGTITVAYPDNTDAGHFTGATGHTMDAMGARFTDPADISLSFGASDITLTYNGSTTIPAGTTVHIGLSQMGGDGVLAEGNRAVGSGLTVIRLGAPDTKDPNGICESQTINTTGTINGALASGGVATFDVPRNVVAAWTNTATITITGTDEYGVTVVETSGSGTSLAGKKAFKTITAVTSSTSITSATVGSGDVLGLPVALPGTGFVIADMENNAAAGTASTIVAADAAAATATTGDVRGTSDPNSACNGTKYFTLVCALPDPDDKGVAQYGG